jgi:hypothetical protein
MSDGMAATIGSRGEPVLAAISTGSKARAIGAVALSNTEQSDARLLSKSPAKLRAENREMTWASVSTPGSAANGSGRSGLALAASSLVVLGLASGAFWRKRR